MTTTQLRADIEEDTDGDVVDGNTGDDPAARYALMLDENLFSGEYAVSPSETKVAWTDTSDALTEANYSYAMLAIYDGAGFQQDEWSETLNSEAIVLSDRNTADTANATGSDVSSIHTQKNNGDWRGSVAYNDNHVNFETTNALDARYGATSTNTDDDLFVDDGTGSDAEMVWSDTNSLTGQDD